MNIGLTAAVGLTTASILEASMAEAVETDLENQQIKSKELHID